jgi:transposase
MELLKQVPGISTKSAETLIAEIGLDMSVFPTDKHLASWAEMCPGNNESAGKKSGRTIQGNKQLTHIAVFQFINVKKTVPNGQKLACL